MECKRFQYLNKKRTFLVEQSKVLEYFIENNTDKDIYVGGNGGIKVSANDTINLGTSKAWQNIADTITIAEGANGSVTVYGLIISDVPDQVYNPNSKC